MKVSESELCNTIIKNSRNYNPDCRKNVEDSRNTPEGLPLPQADNVKKLSTHPVILSGLKHHACMPVLNVELSSIAPSLFFQSQFIIAHASIQFHR
jgi:hypothetical protein